MEKDSIVVILFIVTLLVTLVPAGITTHIKTSEYSSKTIVYEFPNSIELVQVTTGALTHESAVVVNVNDFEQFKQISSNARRVLVTYDRIGSVKFLTYSSQENVYYTYSPKPVNIMGRPAIVAKVVNISGNKVTVQYTPLSHLFVRVHVRYLPWIFLGGSFILLLLLPNEKRELIDGEVIFSWLLVFLTLLMLAIVL